MPSLEKLKKKTARLVHLHILLNVERKLDRGSGEDVELVNHHFDGAGG